MIAPGMTIIAAVAQEHGMLAGDLTGPSKARKLYPPRRAAIRRIRDELGYSYPKIGRLFGRTHPSILWILNGGRGRHRA